MASTTPNLSRSGAGLTLELRGVSHTGDRGAVDGVSLGLAAGTFTVLTGDAGSGKQTLFRLLGLFERAESGELFVAGEGTRAWSDEQRQEFRARHFGFVLAAPFLLPSLTLAENIAMPLFKLSEASAAEAAERAEELLAFTGLAGQAQRAAGDLSLEDQYAAAIARALAIAPAALLVEELDAELHGDALRRVAGVLRDVAELKTMTVLATASEAFPPELAGRVVELASAPAQPILPTP